MKHALISVFDKTGVTAAAAKLHQNGWTILSTGGTARHLAEAGIAVTEIASLTHFPEILDGRVKTLHPAVFSGILAKDTPEHNDQLQMHALPRIRLVMVNFYPFEEKLSQTGLSANEMIESIDIGGPAMVRAAAKNHQNTIVVVDAADYLVVVDELISNGDISAEKRTQLAQKAFAYTSFYDSLIAGYMAGPTTAMPPFFSYAGRLTQTLRYGENPHQKAALYMRDRRSPLYQLDQIQGKELSFNNILDLAMTYEVVNDFLPTKPFAVIVKHQNPCGAALANQQLAAFQNALAGDPKSAFGGIVGFNTCVEADTAKALAEIFFEVIVAPEYSPATLQILAKKKNLRVLRIPLGYRETSDIKTVPGGFVLQERDHGTIADDQFLLKTRRPVSATEQEDINFGWKLIKYVKSNAIILVKNGMLAGVGAGQMSRVDAVELAIKKSTSTAGTVLISDAFFPFPDSVEAASAHGISVAVEPGGSVNDNDVIARAEALGMSLVFTGMRHFRH